MGAIDGIRMIRSQCLLSDGKSALPSLLRIFLIICAFFFAHLEAADLDFEVEGRTSGGEFKYPGAKLQAARGADERTVNSILSHATARFQTGTSIRA
jgi:hypothetical protein